MAAEKLITNHQVFGDELNVSISDVASCSVLTVTVGPGCEELANDFSVQFMASELVNNCAEKQAADIQIGVGLTFDEPSGMYRLVVEDNVHYDPAELARILKNLNRKHSQHEKKSEKRTSKGGIGKSMIQNNLERWGGGLSYEATPDNRIVAVAQWTREGYLHPLPQTRLPTYVDTV